MANNASGESVACKAMMAIVLAVAIAFGASASAATANPPVGKVAKDFLSEAEIGRLLHATRTLERSTRSLLRPELFHLAIVLLYTTGLRRGELLRMTVGDYDPHEHTLLVRASKFHKSRQLPLSSDGIHEVEDYLRARRARHLPTSADTPLLWNGYAGGCGYTGVGLSHGLGIVLKASDIRTPAGRRPRLHDFRHTFAVHALVRWYRAGADVQAKLPLLATYMGHVSVVSTQYYLHFIEPLTTLASSRFAQHYAGLLQPLANALSETGWTTAGNPA